MDGIGRAQATGAADDRQHAGMRPSRLARFRLWLAGYDALAVIAARDNDHLLRDIDLTRDEAADSLRAWRIIGFLLLPRCGRE